jgi:hypothetical protein
LGCVSPFNPLGDTSFLRHRSEEYLSLSFNASVQTGPEPVRRRNWF